MKIHFVVGSLSRNAGGLHESVRRLAQSMVDKTSSVEVFSLQDEFTEEDRSSWNPLPTHAFHVAGPSTLGYAPQLSGAILDKEADLVMSHGIWMYPSAAVRRWHKKTGRPYIIHPHGMLDPWAVKNSRWKKRIAHFLYERDHLAEAACIRALCEAEAKAIRAYGLTNPIAIIPNGIDLPETRRQDSVAVHPPWKGRMEKGRKVLLYLGRIHPKKGLANLLRAWGSIQNSQQPGMKSLQEEWALAIAGWDQGGCEADLKRLASELGIAWVDTRSYERGTEPQDSEMAESASSGHIPANVKPEVSVFFLGPQFGEQKAACYKNCSAFILPSFSEGLPMVVLEAWAHAKPVLMTPECNLPEGFIAGAALPIEPCVNSIATGLQRLFSVPSSALEDFGSQGRTLVATRFSWSTIAADMISVSKWANGAGSAPACVSR